MDHRIYRAWPSVQIQEKIRCGLVFFATHWSDSVIMKVTVFGILAAADAERWRLDNLGPRGEKWSWKYRRQGRLLYYEFTFRSAEDLVWFSLVNL